MRGAFSNEDVFSTVVGSIWVIVMMAAATFPAWVGHFVEIDAREYGMVRGLLDNEHIDMKPLVMAAMADGKITEREYYSLLVTSSNAAEAKELNEAKAKIPRTVEKE